MQKIISKWNRFFHDEGTTDTWWERKKSLFKRRRMEIVRVNVRGKIYRLYYSHDLLAYEYFLHVSFLIRSQDKVLSIEEVIVPFSVKERENKIIEHKQIVDDQSHITLAAIQNTANAFQEDESYSRLAAVRYAEHWWSSFNPIFPQREYSPFNFVYQCLLAGFSQTVLFERQTEKFITSVDFSTFLGPMNVQEVTSPKQLRFGDIILYDLSGKNRWDHVAIVTAKDKEHMPLVNAHFPNCRYRYWSYEDSPLWTTKTTYKFLRIR